MSRTTKQVKQILLGASAMLLTTAPLLQAGVGVDASALTEAVTLEGVRAHQAVFQQIADDNGGNREASGDGYFESVFYVSQQMIGAGYLVSVQLFPYLFFDNVSDPILEQTAPDAVTYTPNDVDGFATMTYSGSADVTATTEGVDVQIPPAEEANSSTSGCEAEDFSDFTSGNIAVLQRGSCSFFQKAFNAQEAGAVGAVIFNEGQPGRDTAFGGTLGGPGVTIPVASAAYAVGEALAADEVTARLAIDAITENRLSANVIADSPIGRTDKTTVIGGHLDSVPEGPGINDNGSGTAAILETALQISALGLLEDPETGIRNRLRFAWWGAEEAGLVGSDYYVATLAERDLDDIVANLNFDMVGSPNFARFVYDGDGSQGISDPGPEGSAFIEWLYTDYFNERGLSNEPTDFSGRSDYAAFIANGIPAGGLFTGAEGIKTEEQVGLYGGTAGEQYDPCYHDTCDTFDNNSDQALDEMSDAIAYSTLVFGLNELPMPAPSKRKKVDASTFLYDGPHLQR